MTQVIFGLGNPGKEYEGTRHNVGAWVAGKFAEKTKSKKVTVIPATTFMNKSGEAIGKVVKSKAVAKNLIVIHDDLDLPFGRFKISFARGAGGHRGVESVIKKLKTEEFIRLRIGIAPTTPSGKIKKSASTHRGSPRRGGPSGEDKIVKFILGKFTPKEEVILKKMMPKVIEALEVITTEGLAPAMNQFN